MEVSDTVYHNEDFDRWLLRFRSQSYSVVEDSSLKAE